MMNYFQIYDESLGFGRAYELPGITRSALETKEVIWVGGFKSLFKIDKKTHKISEFKKPSVLADVGSPINDIYQSDPEGLTIITANDGILRFDLRSEEFGIEDFILSMMRDSLRQSRILDADVSPSGRRTATATDKGVFYQEKGREYDLSLKMASYHNVAFYSDSILYVSSQNRLFRIDLETKDIVTLDQLQGISNDYFKIRSNYKDKEGRLYFGGNQGIDMINEDVYFRATKSKPILLDQLIYNGVPQYPKQDLSLIHI